ncbi:MAG TPA: methylated-DNA--[protein]-cysteine S-methyltransferase, partial [Gemmatimonadales bacterium]
ALTGIRLRARGRRRPATVFERLVARQLMEYGTGERSAFDFPIQVDGSPFCQAVWGELQRIPYGETTTYGDISRRLVGNPGAAQAVGQANHVNPIPIVIPCHRVVAAGGKLGGYGGGVELKRRLLALEEAHSPAIA